VGAYLRSTGPITNAATELGKFEAVANRLQYCARFGQLRV